MRSLYDPSPCWGWGENRKKNAKLVGWDNDRLAEQANEVNSNNNNTNKKNLQKPREYTG